MFFLLEAFDVTSRLPGHRIMAGKRLEFVTSFLIARECGVGCMIGAQHEHVQGLFGLLIVFVLLARFCEGASPTREKNGVSNSLIIVKRCTEGTHEEPTWLAQWLRQIVTGAYVFVTYGKMDEH